MLSMDFVQRPDSGARETLSLLRWSCVSKHENLCLDDLVLILLSGLLCGLALKQDWCFYDQGQAIGSVVGCVLTHVDDMLAAGDIPNLQLVVDALTREREITQSRIIGPSKEGEITHTEIWIAAMPGVVWNPAMSICE